MHGQKHIKICLDSVMSNKKWYDDYNKNMNTNFQ